MLLGFPVLVVYYSFEAREGGGVVARTLYIPLTPCLVLDPLSRRSITFIQGDRLTAVSYPPHGSDDDGDDHDDDDGDPRPRRFIKVQTAHESANSEIGRFGRIDAPCEEGAPLVIAASDLGDLEAKQIHVHFLFHPHNLRQDSVSVTFAPNITGSCCIILVP